MGIPEHLTCLLRNLYAGQEATVRTWHGTTDWFQIGKGEHQGYILSPGSFNLYAEWIVKVVQLCLTIYDPMDCPWNSLGLNTGVGSLFLLQVIFPPRNETQVSCIAGRFFTSWATREAQEYWNGSLSLLQRIFLTQELNCGLLHCRWILYQLCYQGNPICRVYHAKCWAGGSTSWNQDRWKKYQ